MKIKKANNDKPHRCPNCHTTFDIHRDLPGWLNPRVLWALPLWCKHCKTLKLPYNDYLDFPLIIYNWKHSRRLPWHDFSVHCGICQKEKSGTFRTARNWFNEHECIEESD